MRRAEPLVVVVALGLCGCVLEPVDYTGKACPTGVCPGGYVCFEGKCARTAPDSGDDGGVDGGDAGLDASVPCVAPTSGMTLTQDTVLCPGTFSLFVPSGQAALRIEAPGVELTCLGTVITGNNPSATGISVGAHHGVTVRGCAVSGFRYGLWATGASGLSVYGVSLDDNFSDRDAGWRLFDDQQGGGLRLERVDGGQVWDSGFSRNWNGVEVRDSQHVRLSRLVAQGCSNIGVLLRDARDVELADSRLSYNYRGQLDVNNLATAWYGRATFDSAAIVVDGRTANARILRNEATYSGGGLYVRNRSGPCPRNTVASGNDFSFSPNNAVEVICDDSQLVDNIASDSNFGMWLGKGDHMLVRGNRVERNRHDGVSIQNAEHRHTVLEGNVIGGNGRAGVLLSGRDYPPGASLGAVTTGTLFNSSHFVLQRNVFSPANTRADIFISASRSVLLASNCGQGPDGGPNLLVPPGGQAELLRVVGACDAGASTLAVSVGAPSAGTVGQPVTLTAASDAGAASYTWLVQPAGLVFPDGTLPPAPLAQTSGSSESFVPPGPNVYDVLVTVDDGRGAALAARQVGVPPSGGRRVGQSPGEWSYSCDSCVTTFSWADGGFFGPAVRMVTNAPFEHRAFAPAAGNLGLDAGTLTAVGAFFWAKNPNGLGWQGSFPVFTLASADGGSWVKLTPAKPLLPVDGDEWVYVEAPVAGSASWTRSTSPGGAPARVDRVEIHTDTWGLDPTELWIDALTVR